MQVSVYCLLQRAAFVFTISVEETHYWWRDQLNLVLVLSTWR